MGLLSRHGLCTYKGELVRYELAFTVSTRDTLRKEKGEYAEKMQESFSYVVLHFEVTSICQS